MTVETHYVAELTDILAIRLECPECGTVTSYRPSQKQEAIHIVAQCSRCHKTWFGPGAGDLKNNVDVFIQVLQNLVGTRDWPVNLTLEFGAPKP